LSRFLDISLCALLISRPSYCTYKSTYKYVDVLQQFVTSYNDTVHTAICIGQAPVTVRHVLEMCTPMNDKRSRVRVVRVKFQVGQHFSQ